MAGLTDDEKKLVLGGEVHMWSEQTDPVNLDDMVWPRASAAGEILWSGRQDASGENRSQIDASPRLAEMRERMVLRGVKAGPVQMVFCTQNNATECSLGADPTTSSAPTSTAPGMIVSMDGTCGSLSTCEGSSFGDCCSQFGFCGRTEPWCGTGCQEEFGTCFSAIV
jgi:hypothetical protein